MSGVLKLCLSILALAIAKKFLGKKSANLPLLSGVTANKILDVVLAAIGKGKTASGASVAPVASAAAVTAATNLGPPIVIDT